MSIPCKTVWTAIVDGRMTFVTRPEAAVEEGGAARRGFVVSNDPEALRGLTPADTVVSAGEVYRLPD